MKPIKFISLFPIYVAGCGSTACLDADCSTDALDTKEIIDMGFTQATKAIEDEVVTVPADARAKLDLALATLSTEDCIPVAFMAARWTVHNNEFDGLLLKPNGVPVADVDGRFAPAHPDFGVFAGGYTPFEDDPKVIVCEEDPEIGDKPDVADAGGCVITPEPTDYPYSSPIGGTYLGNHTFSGSLMRGATALPVNGVWMATDEAGGIGIGVILACDEKFDETAPSVDPDKLETD